MNDIQAPLSVNRSLNCKGCGALLRFLPGTHQLHCDYCGENNLIDTEPETAPATYDLDAFLVGTSGMQLPGDLTVVRCNSCGSQTMLDQFVTSDQCPFCSAPLVVDQTAAKQYVLPHYILPFGLNQQEASEKFRAWIRSLWWAPNDLEKKLNNSLTTLKGVYMPHWAFDTDTVTHYTGERGDYYYTTKTYTVQENGETKTRTRQVRHTRWSYASGTISRYFKDQTIPASRSLPEKTLLDLEPWPMHKLVRFDDRFMSGFRSETYQIDAKDGFLKMAQLVEPTIRNDVRSDIGGDEQRIDSIDTVYNDKRVKYIMLPVWVSSYRYGDKTYQFAVNADTGEVIGERPLSAWKITLAILLALAIIAAVIYYFQQPQQ